MGIFIRKMTGIRLYHSVASGRRQTRITSNNTPFGGTEGGLFLYPNPTSSEMTVALNNPAIKIVQMELYDLTNRKLHQQIINQSYGTLRMNELSQGVCILKVWVDNGDVENKNLKLKM